MEKNEITFELTNYCPNQCKYCSSSTVADRKRATFLDFDRIVSIIGDRHFDRIILSGGEPLAHPRFYDILQIARVAAEDVVVYTNEITHICYNASVIDGIYVEVNLTINDDTNKVRILRRTGQGREGKRPEVTLSSNFDGECDCNSPVVLPTGRIAKSPCRKDKIE
jgi:MoaA/NifB/PqqE/SkfB family radical SAM enzyme